MTTVKARPCSACHASVYDLEHVRTRRSAPIDARADPKGTILIDIEDGFYTIVRQGTLTAMTPEERQKLHTNHFATCRYADRFRRGRKPERGHASGPPSSLAAEGGSVD